MPVLVPRTWSRGSQRPTLRAWASDLGAAEAESLHCVLGLGPQRMQADIQEAAGRLRGGAGDAGAAATTSKRAHAVAYIRRQ